VLSRQEYGRIVTGCKWFGMPGVVYALGERITDIRHDTYTPHFLVGIIDRLPQFLTVD
jgi:hypothetical protein